MRLQLERNIGHLVAEVMNDHGLDKIMTPFDRFADAGLDGVDIIEIVRRTEDKFQITIPDEEITENSRLDDFTELVNDLLRKKAERAPQAKPEWKEFPPQESA